MSDDSTSSLASAASNADDSAESYAFSLLTRNPMRKFECQKRWSSEKKSEMVARKEEHVDALMSFLSKMIDLPSCYSQHSKVFTKCQCLISIEEGQLFSLAHSLGE